jgi:hypothetical protein
MAFREEEMTGGRYSVPQAAAAFTAPEGSYVLGFIAGDDGDVSSITYYDGDAHAEADYTGCLSGHYYHFPSKMIAATFGMAVTLVFE